MKKNLTLYLDEDLIKKMKAYAKSINRSLSSIVEDLLREFIANPNL